MKRNLTRFLLLTLCAGLTSGCSLQTTTSNTASTSNSQESAQSDDTNEGSETTMPTSALSSDDSQTQGRYIEEEIDLPEELTDGSLNVDSYPGKYPVNGIVDYYAYDETYQNFYRYTLGDDLTWSKESMEWAANSLPDDIAWLQQVTYGADGYGYLLYYTSESDDIVIPHIIKQISDTQGQELEIAAFKETDSKDTYPYPNYIEVDSDGTIYLIDTDTCSSFDPDTGKTLQTFNTQYCNYNMTLSDDYIYLFDTTSGVIDCYDKGNGSLEKSYDYSTYDESTSCLSINNSGQLCLLVREGIYTIQSDNTIWEMILDGTLGSLANPSIYPHALISGDDNDYYIASTCNSPQLYHCYYSEDVSTLPDEVLTIYSLYDSDQVRQAISDYQTLHPDTKVSFRVVTSAKYDYEKEDIDTSDYINSLNTELLAGGGSDILILDDLPYQSYIEKGILADLYDYVPTLSTDDVILPSILCNSETDGSIYALPTLFNLYAVQAPDNILSSMDSIHSIASYMQTTQQTDLFSTWTNSDFVDFILSIESDRLMTQDSFVTQEEMVQLFEDIRSIQTLTDNGLSTDTLESSEDSIAQIDQLVSDNNTIMATYLYGLYGCMGTASLVEDRDDTLSLIKGQYEPELIVGINQNSTNKEAAGELIDLLLSSDVQSMPSNTMYFSVRTDCIDSMTDYEDNSIGGSIGDYDYTFPDQAMRKQIVSLCHSITTQRPNDTTLYDLYEQSFIEFLDGTTDAQSAGQQLYNKVFLYLNE